MAGKRGPSEGVTLFIRFSRTRQQSAPFGFLMPANARPVTRIITVILCIAPCFDVPARDTPPGTQLGSSYAVPWWTVDAGDGRAIGTSSGLRIDGTLGQAEPEPVALCSADGGPACFRATYTLRGGFWAGLQSPIPSPGCEGAAGCLFRDGFELSPTVPTLANALGTR